MFMFVCTGMYLFINLYAICTYNHIHIFGYILIYRMMYDINWKHPSYNLVKIKVSVNMVCYKRLNIIIIIIYLLCTFLCKKELLIILLYVNNKIIINTR